MEEQSIFNLPDETMPLVILPSSNSQLLKHSQRNRPTDKKYVLEKQMNSHNDDNAVNTLEKNEQVPDENSTESMDVDRAICVEDAAYSRHLPRSFQQLLCSLTEHGYEYDVYDLYALATFVTAIEHGFSWQKTEQVAASYDARQFQFDMRTITAVPIEAVTAAKKQDAYSFTLYLGGREDFACQLSVKKHGDKLIANVFAVGPMFCESLAFSLSTSGTSNDLNFATLRIFCVKCKENLFYKVKTTFLRPHGMRVPCLTDLPDELVVMICKKLQPKEFGRLCLSCRLFYHNYYDSKTLVTFFKNAYGLDVFEDRNKLRRSCSLAKRPLQF